jgi:hypothetical protein
LNPYSAMLAVVTPVWACGQSVGLSKLCGSGPACPYPRQFAAIRGGGRTSSPSLSLAMEPTEK